MKLYLARHGQTNYNALDICNTDPTIDVYLTPTGVAQAKAMANALKEVRFDAIYISEMKRTAQTAEAINTFHNLKLEVDPRLNDILSGFEGKPYKDYVKALDSSKNRWTAHFDGGESIEDMKARVAKFFSGLRTRGYDSVLIVTSEWIIRAIFTITQNMTNEEAWSAKIEQGSYVELDV